ncbi:MAG: hypothetical protein H3C68_04190 [Deltaproteobacteria bacterium]|nr:hypothetical protein [Deltaproteobacteria bacterium]MBZ0219925.1 hypothetical protein [Deltaproteobacteria bacterium]
MNALGMVLGLALAAVVAFVLPQAFAHTDRMEMESFLWEDSRAEVEITDTAEGAKEITIRAEDLMPDSMYTVWLVSEERREAEMVSPMEHGFRTDSDGNGVFSAVVPEEELGRWERIEVAWHPEGAPTVEGMQTAFAAGLEGIG